MATTTSEKPSNSYQNDSNSYTKEYAASLDRQDTLREFRNEFIIPSKKDLKRTQAMNVESNDDGDSPSIYLCGNSLGVQPKGVRKYIDAYLRSWAIKGVRGHFDTLSDTPFSTYLDADTTGSELLAPLVGASPSEVALMGTLTGNLHLLMASFYRPTKEKFKIIMEGRAFPSDHYAVESQIIHNGFIPEEAMVLIEPEDFEAPILQTNQILEVIDEHASQTALILLPGVQYYTGQYFDIAKITQHAHSKGLLIGWDCAHAVGNVDLKLHDWDVDFAAWCHYKYVNSGPGAMAGLFIHERHGQVNKDSSNGQGSFRPRLTGWWGHDRSTRFEMDNKFVPQAGAAGYQVSNPSILDMSPVAASLEIFNRATISRLRKKSVDLTGYLEHLLLSYPLGTSQDKPFRIITPLNPSERGAQLSLLLKPGLLDKVLEHLEANGVVVDERKPNVIRVAPAPLYNNFTDVWEFYHIFSEACRRASERNEV